MSFDFADINGTKIHYEVRGEGTAVTLIHAGIVNLHMWDEQMEALAQNHQVLRYDVRGWGETAAPPATYTDHDDLRGLLQHLGIAQTAIVGCSGGGRSPWSLPWLTRGWLARWCWWALVWVVMSGRWLALPKRWRH